VTEAHVNAARFDVVGIGNALVDVLSHETDAFVHAHSLVKGSMTLIDTDFAERLYGLMGPGLEMSGGSAANTAAGVASFGGSAAYVGKVSDDQLGNVFAHDLRSLGVHVANQPTPRNGDPDLPPTGRCLIVVTPDAQRTMHTYLGMSELLTVDDIPADVVAAGKVLYLEGYLWDRPAAMEAYRHAARVAHQADRLVALTLSDSFCVHRHHREFLNLVENEVDILFANEAELHALYGMDTLDEGLARARRDCSIVSVTCGPRGSIVATPDEVVHCDAYPVGPVDTTGAGDLYASGFLYGLTQGLAPSDWGRLGNLAAGEVIQHMGPRPQVSLSTFS
jgi:sugar/nucleoside kinase (ribokinase family)